MKKLSVKKISIFIIIVCIVVSIIYWQNRKNSFDYRKKQYIQELLCVPEKPLDKGIIYAESMKQYWIWNMDHIWNHYTAGKNSPADDERYYSEITKTKCGLEETFFGKRSYSSDNCFPRVSMKNGITKIYNPEKDDYLYKPENYNKNVDFSIYTEFSGFSYKEDCCKLLTYEEMIDELDSIKQTEELKVYQYKIESIDINILLKMYFLRVIENGGYYHSKEYKKYNYYPVSQCGKISYFTYFHWL